MGRGKRNPGCLCCGSSSSLACVNFETTFTQADTSVHSEINDDLDVTAGTWEIQSNRLVPTSTSARIVYTGDTRTKHQVLRIKEMRGAENDVVNLYARWISNIDHIRFNITYRATYADITVYNYRAQMGFRKRAYEIKPDTDHMFHWGVSTDPEPELAVSNNAHDIPDVWAYWFVDELFAPDFLLFRGSGAEIDDLASPPAYSHATSYYYAPHDSDAYFGDGEYFAIGTGGTAANIQISDVALYRTDRTEDLAATEGTRCARTVSCGHIGIDYLYGIDEPDADNGVVNEGDWTNAAGTGVETYTADDLFLYQHDIEATADRFADVEATLNFAVDGVVASDGVELVFDYVDSSNYKFRRVNVYAQTSSGFTTVLTSSQYGIVVAGVESATKALLSGNAVPNDATSPTLTGEIKISYVYDTWQGYTQQFTPNTTDPSFYSNHNSANKSLIGFRSLAGNTGTVNVTSFTAKHNSFFLEPDTAGVYGVGAYSGICIHRINMDSAAQPNPFTAARYVCAYNHIPRRFEVYVSGHARLNGPYTFEIQDGENFLYSSWPVTGTQNRYVSGAGNKHQILIHPGTLNSGIFNTPLHGTIQIILDDPGGGFGTSSVWSLTYNTEVACTSLDETFTSTNANANGSTATLEAQA